MPGERGEGVVGSTRRIRDLDGSLERRDRFVEPPEAAVDSGEDVETHGEIENRSAVATAGDGRSSGGAASLEGLRRADRVVQSLVGTFAGSYGVASELEEEGAEIRVVEGWIVDVGYGGGGGGDARRVFFGGSAGGGLGSRRGGGRGLLHRGSWRLLLRVGDGDA